MDINLKNIKNRIRRGKLPAHTFVKADKPLTFTHIELDSGYNYDTDKNGNKINIRPKYRSVTKKSYLIRNRYKNKKGTQRSHVDWRLLSTMYYMKLGLDLEGGK